MLSDSDSDETTYRLTKSKSKSKSKTKSHKSKSESELLHRGDADDDSKNVDKNGVEDDEEDKNEEEDEESGEDNIHQLTINEHYAKAFAFRKEREELDRCALLFLFLFIQFNLMFCFYLTFFNVSVLLNSYETNQIKSNQIKIERE